MNDNRHDNLRIRPAAASEVVDLRHAVLRAGLPRETAIFAGDDLPTTRHFVATAPPEDRIVGCVTILQSLWETQPAWQLRGMAIEPTLQRAGVGSKLLASVEQFVTGERSSPTPPAHLLWCNARVPASGFYVKHGWRIVSDVFDIPSAGPHLKMLKRV